MGRQSREKKARRSSRAGSIEKAPSRFEISDKEITLDPWSFPAPANEYYADLVTIDEINGAPTFTFAQQGPTGGIQSALAIVMGRPDFNVVVTSFNPVIEQIDRHLKEWQDVAPTPLVLGNVPEDRYHKYHASIVRGGCGPSFAMLDFYSQELLVPQRMKYAGEDGLDIRPLVRIRVSPPLLNSLFIEIKTKGLR